MATRKGAAGKPASGKAATKKGASKASTASKKSPAPARKSTAAAKKATKVTKKAASSVGKTNATAPAKAREATQPPKTSKASGKPAKRSAVAPREGASAGRTTKTQPASRKRGGNITPEQALANTRALLEAKQQHDRETPPWQAIGASPGQPPQAGFQSDEARRKANELHSGESRQEAIQGSVATHDRHNQGKRDSR
jgi:hypothetical protein